MIETAGLISPIGDIRIAVRDGRLCGLTFDGAWRRVEESLRARFGGERERTARDPAGVVSALRDYFDGDVRAIEAVPVDLDGTPFRRKVWSALRRIPAGRTISYGELARSAGTPAAVRAAGTTCGANPVAIVVPCHRVVRSDGSLGGYGGGVAKKEWLLAHERSALAHRPRGARAG